MAAPRYITDYQQHVSWLCLTTIWAVCGLVACVNEFSTGDRSGDAGASSSLLLLCACAATGITAVLRLPILASPPKASLEADHLVWLLSCMAQINWLGFFVMRAESAFEIVPLVLAFAAGDVWFYSRARAAAVLPWLWHGLAHAQAWLLQLGVEAKPVAGAELKANKLTAEHQAPTSLPAQTPGMAVAIDADSAGRIVRRTVEGIDEQGRRYLSGEIELDLGPEASSQVVVIPFQPAFVGAPEVDFECAADQVEMQLSNCTPQGMRLNVRRTARGEPATIALQWYAVEVELGELPRETATQRSLP